MNYFKTRGVIKHNQLNEGDVMRFLISFSFQSDLGNSKVADPEFGNKFNELFKGIGTEAVYLCPVGGQRGGYLVVNINDPSMIGSIAEKFWHFLEADVEFTPVMIPEDLVKIMPEIRATHTKWGQ
jgi:hypothetical protein